MSQQFIHQLFSATAESFAREPAIVSADRRLSYGELEAWSNNVANYLLKQGLEKGDAVALALENRFAVIAGILGVLKSGGVFMPVDLSMPEARLASMAAEVPPAFVLTESGLAADCGRLLGAHTAETPVLPVDLEEDTDDHPCLLPRLEEGQLANVSERPEVAWDGDDPCYVYFTSGSTGRPKAILGRIKAIDHFVRWEIEHFGVTPGSRVSQLTAPIFDAFLRDAFVPLCAGGQLCVAGDPETLLSPDGLCRWLTEQDIHLVHSVPSLFRTMLTAELDAEMFPSLRYVLLAGEPLMPSDVERWHRVFGDRIRLVNLYGSTETTMVKLFYEVQPEDAERRIIPIGQPMPGARALVLDEDLQPCEPGTVGEIYIRTPYRTLGYYQRPDLDEQVFVPNPLSEDPADIIYRTGDMGRMLDDDNLEFFGRRDQQVKIRGVRVELGEIENLLLGSELAREAAVVDREDTNGNKYLCAYVVPAERTSVDAIRDYLANRLAESQMPSAFLELEELPLTATGKVDRKALPAPEDMLGAQRSEYVAPRTETEIRVAEVFADVLKVEQVGAEDHFFQLGGHSLLAMVLLSRLSAAFEVEMPLAVLFDAPVVADLARAIDDKKQEAETPADAIESIDQEFEQVLQNIGELSDSDVDSLLEDIVSVEA